MVDSEALDDKIWKSSYMIFPFRTRMENFTYHVADMAFTTWGATWFNIMAKPIYYIAYHGVQHKGGTICFGLKETYIDVMTHCDDSEWVPVVQKYMDIHIILYENLVVFRHLHANSLVNGCTYEMKVGQMINGHCMPTVLYVPCDVYCNTAAYIIITVGNKCTFE